MDIRAFFGVCIRRTRKGIVPPALILFVAAVGCGGSGSNGENLCDGPIPSSPDTQSSGYDISAVGDIRYTSSFSIAEAPEPNGDNVGEIEWMPAYAVANLTKEKVCVRDISISLPENRDSAGRLFSLKSNGNSRLVEIYPNLNPTSIPDEKGTVTKKPPFILDPGAKVLVRFHQYFTLTVDGAPVPLKGNDNLSQLLGPLFSLPHRPDGSYQCVPYYRSLRVVVRSNLGESNLETVNAIMPTGCVLNLPDLPR